MSTTVEKIPERDEWSDFDGEQWVALPPLIGEISSERRPGPVPNGLAQRKPPGRRLAVETSQGHRGGMCNGDSSRMDGGGNAEDYRMRYLLWSKGFDFVDPQVEQVDIRDVAHALSALPRFGGHSNERYSVGQHCLLVREIVCDELGRPDLARDALLHDAAEAFTGDLIRPFKRLVESKCDVIRTIELAVACALGYQCPTPAIVKQADQIALWAEVARFFPTRPQVAVRRQHIKIDRVLAPGRVEEMFLEAYRDLTNAKAA